MSQINIKKALKLKNKLLSDINKEWQKVSQYNSCVIGGNMPYDVKASYEKWHQLKGKLVELKTKIHLANAPVYEVIFAMSEMKDSCKLLSSLGCNEGTIIDRYGRNETPLVYTAIISISENEKNIILLEKKIEELQDVLETHNASTKIEFEI